jgi:RNA-directed DNA polymerase
MMNGHEKSDSVIVAAKPANKMAHPAVEQSATALSAAEPVERRAGAKGNANQQSTRRTQSRVRVSHALERIRQTFAVMTRAGKPSVRICAGGAQ